MKAQLILADSSHPLARNPLDVIYQHVDNQI